MYGVAQIALRRLRGGLEEIAPLVEAMVEQFPLVPAWRSGLAYLYREIEDRDGARAQLEWLARDGFAPLPHDGNWIVGAAILSTVCHLIGDKQRAAELYEQFSQYEDYVVLAGLPADILGSAHHFLMLLAATVGDWQLFERHANEALSRNESMGALPWLATTQVEVASVLTTRGFDGDLDRATELLGMCVAICDDLGLPALKRRAEGIRERTGPHLGRPASG